MDDIVSSTTNQLPEHQTDNTPLQDVSGSYPTQTSPIGITTSDIPFKVNEIICLENDCTCLYGEIIQLLPNRGLCWFRPMCLVAFDPATQWATQPTQLIDLQSGSDLLWPISLFRPVLDTEVISFLPHLSDRSGDLANKSSGKQSLNKFIHQVWQNNQDKFRSEKSL